MTNHGTGIPSRATLIIVEVSGKSEMIRAKCSGQYFTSEGFEVGFHKMEIRFDESVRTLLFNR